VGVRINSGCLVTGVHIADVNLVVEVLLRLVRITRPMSLHSWLVDVAVRRSVQEGTLQAQLSIPWARTSRWIPRQIIIVRAPWHRLLSPLMHFLY